MIRVHVRSWFLGMFLTMGSNQEDQTSFKVDQAATLEQIDFWLGFITWFYSPSPTSQIWFRSNFSAFNALKIGHLTALNWTVRIRNCGRFERICFPHKRYHKIGSLKTAFIFAVDNNFFNAEKLVRMKPAICVFAI